ncbi:MAG: hypothetical protein ACREYF_19180 [Gammaproteobacteria bacterium]
MKQDFVSGRGTKKRVSSCLRITHSFRARARAVAPDFIHGEAIGIGQTPLVASSYLAVAVLLIACAKFAVPVPKPAEMAELEVEHARQ